jgi:HAD superfamily 5'-nucleotidase-like hydrolase
MNDSNRRTSAPEILDGLDHLLEVPRPEPIPAAREVYVNRNLRMDQIDLVGFDMDYTLALYRKPHIEELAFEMTAARLVEKRGYPPEIARLQYRAQFCIRGLVVDKKHGDVIKMDRYRHVGRAFHGLRPLTKEERRAHYRGPRIRLVPPRYHLVDTLFALPEIALFAELVERKTAEPNAYPPFDRIFDDIRASIDEVHRDGSLKAIVQADLPRFFVADPELPLALHKLRSSGKRLFVLTNSLLDYTEAVMSHLLSGKLADYPSWRNFFDIVVVGAEKPRFFTERNDFHVLDARGGMGDVASGRFDRQRVYQGGNLAAFERMAEAGGDRILYIGDHIFGDILRSKKSSAWRTGLVVEELEEEIRCLDRHAADFERLRALGARCRELDSEVNYLTTVHRRLRDTLERSSVAEPDRARLAEARKKARARVDASREQLDLHLRELSELEDAMDLLANPYWGLLFREGMDPTRFADQVEDYACIYTSRVSNLLYYSANQYFRSQSDLLPHERR